MQYFKDEIQSIRNDLKNYKDDPIIDDNYILADLGISKRYFSQNVKPHLTFMFRPHGMRTYRARLSDYKKWKEEQANARAEKFE